MDLSEGGARLRVLRRLADGQLGAAGHARAQLEAPDVEDVERDLVALADLAQQVLFRDDRVLQDERPGGGALDARLLLLGAQAHAGRALVDDERGEVLAVHLRERDVDVGEAGVREPHLLAVQDPARAVGREDRPGLRVHGVRGGARLRERVGADPLAGHELGQVLLLLLGRAEVDDGQRADAGVAHVGDGEAAVARRRLRGDAAGDLVEAHAAVLLGDLDAQQAQLARLREQLARGLVLEGQDLRDARDHLVLHERGRRLADHALLFAEIARA